MLQETMNQQVQTHAQPQNQEHKVSCFVCKKAVDRGGAKQIVHAKEKKVWVCESHIK